MSYRKITVALAGNANVGKSVIFNQLTGLHQHVGNWPGKTVTRAEGTLTYMGHEIDVIDLPGIYSLSAYSIEELVSREYIAFDQPDVLVNVVDATSLERNLAFTFQLMELEPRMVIALNQIDVAESKGIIVYPETLSELIGVPVVPTVAVKGAGLTDLVENVIDLSTRPKNLKPLRYGREIEKSIDTISSQLRMELPYPKRWVGIKLLEGDEKIQEIIFKEEPSLRQVVEAETLRLERIHGHDIKSIIASERYSLASEITQNCMSLVVPETTFGDRLESVTSHPILGYVFMVATILLVFLTIFAFGDWLASTLDAVFSVLRTLYYDRLGETNLTRFIWNGLAEGIIGGIVIVLPYIAPFYLVLSVLEDSGYLARIAFLMDSAMHAIGLHGKGFIPIMLGFGCNVPAVLGAKIMETERERLICAFVATMVPCAARSVVIMGLVAAYVGFEWAFSLYVIDFILIFILGRIAYKIAPDEPVGLIMEIPGYRLPSLKTTVQRTWFRLKGFIYEAFPIMVAGNLVIQIAAVLGLLTIVGRLMNPVTSGWLGLPQASGVVLIFGVLRKELTLILLASLMGSNDFSSFLTPLQMFVFAFVVMVYVPCLSTIAALVKEFSLREAAIISLSEIAVAVILGGLIFRVLMVLGLP